MRARGMGLAGVGLLLALAGCAPMGNPAVDDAMVQARWGAGRSPDCPGGFVSNQEASQGGAYGGTMQCADPTLMPGENTLYAR